MAITPEDFIKNSSNANQNMLKNTLIDLEPDNSKEWGPYEDAQTFLNFMSTEEEPMTLKTHSVLCRDLPFYKDGQLLTVIENGEDIPDLFCLKAGDDIVILDGNFAYIAEINETGALHIDKNNVADYAKFFSYFTLFGEAEEEETAPILLIEGENSEHLRDVSPYMKKRVLKNYNGYRVISSTDKKSFMISTRIIHENTIYDVRLKIDSDGNYEFTDEQYISVV